MSNKRALVLSAGGPAGTPWLLGILDGLRSDSVDLGDADLIVGTSAGALIGAPLASGTLDQVVAMYRRLETPPFKAPITYDEFGAAAMRAAAGVRDAQEVVRRIANIKPLGTGLVSEEQARRLFSAHLSVTAWPGQRLVVAAVDADSGLRTVFDVHSGVRLLDAVMASCAGPGVFPLVTINGRRYADGGLRSPYNIDLAVGYDVVTVLSPLQLNPHLQQALDAEVAGLVGATVHVITADEVSLAAIGPNLLSQETATAALDAGQAQAARESDTLKSIWHSRS